jgi:single-stranded-DNA-specific exonuclease
LDDATCCVDLLLTPDPRRAAEIAQTLEGFNRERQALEEETLREALALADTSPMVASLVLAGEGWHPGVIGIVASRLVERFGRPTVLIALDGDHGKGSGRSVPGVDLYRMLSASASHLLTFGGHPAAAGLAIARDQVAQFAAQFEQMVHCAWPADQRTPVLSYDVELTVSDLATFPWEDIEQLQPCGQGWPSVSIRIRRARPTAIRPLRGGHARFVLTDGQYQHAVILFGDGAKLTGDDHDLLLIPEISVFRGKKQRQWRVRDFRPANNVLASTNKA